MTTSRLHALNVAYVIFLPVSSNEESASRILRRQSSPSPFFLTSKLGVNCFP